MPLRIAIGCGHQLFCEGLRKLLEDEKDMEVIGSFTESDERRGEIEKVLGLNPDIILADFSYNVAILDSLPGDSLNSGGVRLLLIGDRSVRIVADRHMRDMITRGVVGILPASADADLLKKALKAIFKGELWLDRSTLVKILSLAKHSEKKSGLAKREKEIVFHICQGYRNKEIAEKLNISEQTVKSHCNRIYKKLGVSDRLQLALYSYQMWPEYTKIPK
jgi:DNA-binding NarL/FixJ family response regulator